MQSIEVPELDDPRVLRYAKCGEPSQSTILVWNTCKTIRTGTSRQILGFAFWPAGFKEPLFINDDLITAEGHAYDDDETLAAVLAFVVDNDACARTDEQLRWARSAEARALELDLAVSDDAKDFTHLFFEIVR
jgi:hypothetical protein